MDSIRKLMSNMLTEREIIIFLLIDSGMSYRDLATRLGVSHGTIQNTYELAKQKLDRFAQAGFFSSPVEKVSKKQ